MFYYANAQVLWKLGKELNLRLAQCVCVCVLKQFPSAVQKTDNKLSKLSLALTMLSIALALGIVQHCSKSH